MRIGILTHHKVHNHGAILQMFALIRTLEEKGHQVQVLDFKRNFDYVGVEMENKYSLSLRSIPFYTKYILQNGLKRTFYNFQKKRTLGRFYKENKVMGAYFSRAKDLDGVFIGSDEVFSIDIGLTPCLWSFGVPCDVVCSYAASFGPTNLEDIRQKKVAGLMTAGLKQMNKVAVRDQNSKSIVHILFDKECVLTCDPVILYGYPKTLATAQRPVDEKYVLVYSYDANMNEPEEVKVVRDYAAPIGAKVYSVGFFHKWCDRSINVSPIELLQWIKHAELVVTDTFHGCVMSIVANTEFVVKIRGNGNKVRNLLEEYLLTSRISDFPKLLGQVADQAIDWQAVNQQVSERRAQSMTYLDSCLELMKHGK
ncbi:MAG: polysaccharide pyruvyl transferase family protein [Saccharofermentanales bacterium]|jgi:hypothetical protein